jgi:hypothetical protein
MNLTEYLIAEEEMTDSHNTIAAEGAAHQTKMAEYSDKLIEKLIEIVSDHEEIALIVEDNPDYFHNLLSNMVRASLVTGTYTDQAFDLLSAVIRVATVVARDRIQED